jgi:hypothetical protein
MPTTDVEAERRRANRALAKSRKVGDFITCDGPVARLSPTAAEREAEAAAAEAKAAEDRRWFLKSLGPW